MSEKITVRLTASDEFDEQLAKLKRRIDMLERKVYRPKPSATSWYEHVPRVGFGKGRSCE